MDSDSIDPIEDWNSRWLAIVKEILRVEMAAADPGHGLEHVERVINNALQIAETLPVDYSILLPATWFHDCVCVAKNSPLRSQASKLAAQRAKTILLEIGYPSEKLPAIAHAIESHSFSAGIPCTSLEAEVLQDADRLEALGAIGLARCLMTGGSMGQRLYHPEDPFPTERTLRDDQQSVDHFFAKLLKLPGTMQTPSGKAIAGQRADYLVGFLKQLGHEIGVPFDRSFDFSDLHSH